MTIFHSCDFLCCALNYNTNFFILKRFRFSINYNSAKEIGSNWNLMRRWLIILRESFTHQVSDGRNSRGLQLGLSERLMIGTLEFSEMKTFSRMARDFNDEKMEVPDFSGVETTITDTLEILGFCRKPFGQQRYKVWIFLRHSWHWYSSEPPIPTS